MNNYEKLVSDPYLLKVLSFLLDEDDEFEGVEHGALANFADNCGVPLATILNDVARLEKIGCVTTDDVRVFPNDTALAQVLSAGVAKMLAPPRLGF